MEKIFLGMITGTIDECMIWAVCAMVDFISYAHFEVHMEQSLKKMDRAWSAIHKNKLVFLELDLHKHFNISKFHSMIHYVSSIRTYGTLDGYNIKSPEHLHIDLVKIPFKASNKQDYTTQMMTWMTRHDAVWHYEMFLNWAKGNGFIKEESEEENGGDNAKPKRNRQQQEEEVEVRDCCGYKVAKKPGYGNVTVDALVNKLHDEHFPWYLEEFLLAHSLPLPQSHNMPLSVFKCLSVILLQIPQVTDLTNLSNIIQTIYVMPLGLSCWHMSLMYLYSALQYMTHMTWLCVPLVHLMPILDISIISILSCFRSIDTSWLTFLFRPPFARSHSPFGSPASSPILAHMSHINSYYQDLFCSLLNTLPRIS